jgi:hypothetical protein
MTRPFRNASNRCPIRDSSQKVRPAFEFFSQERRPEIGFADQLWLPRPTNKVVNPIRRSSAGVGYLVLRGIIG